MDNIWNGTVGTLHYHCPYCGVSWVDAKEYDEHMKKHPDGGKFGTATVTSVDASKGIITLQTEGDSSND